MKAETSQAVPGLSAGRGFARVYQIALIAFVAMALCLPVLIPVSFRIMGFDPALQTDYSVESFDAWRETAPLRQRFIYVTFTLGLALMGLSIAALVRRWKGRRDVHPLVAGVALVGASALAFLLFVAMITPGVVLCC